MKTTRRKHMQLAVRKDPMHWMSRFFDDDNWMADWSYSDENQMDMYEEGDKVILKVKAPDFAEKDIEVSIENNVITVTGKKEKVEEEQDKKRKYYKKEMSTTSFTRSVTLPGPVKADEAIANFRNGVLKITIPKSEEAKPKKIHVNGE